MTHLGPIAFTEAIHDKIRICAIENNCGEYIVMSWGVFADPFTARKNISPAKNF